MTLSATPIAEQPCPQCKTPMPIVRGFVTWCEACNWNIRPQEKDRRYSMQEQIWMRLGQRSGQALADELKQTPPTTPTLRLSTIGALVIALLVHSATVLFFVLGVQLFFIFREFGNWFALLGSIILLGIAWLTRPQFGKVPPLVSRDEFPTLCQVVDQIAEGMTSRKVDGIAISPQYNASFGRYGWQQKAILELGLPLFLATKGQEKVALIGHEIAHNVSGDPFRSFWLTSAIRTMQQWLYLVHPARSTNLAHGTIEGAMVDISSWVTNLLGNILERFLYVVAYTLAILTYRTSQRAEYRADYLAAQVSGTNGVLRVMDKLYLPSNFYTLVQRFTLNTDKNTDIFTEFEGYLATLPVREKERLHRANLMDGARLDESHPPTAYRIEVLQAHPIHIPKVNLAPDVEARIEQELAKLRQPVQRDLLENFRRYLYY